MASEEPVDITAHSEDIDTACFEQILEMDEEDDHEFSQGIVFGFLEQATETFKKMDDALKAKDLKTLADLGHYLKGSSATLGFVRVKDECEKIQHYGHGKDETGEPSSVSDDENLKLIGVSVSKAKRAFEFVSNIMEKFYDQMQG